MQTRMFRNAILAHSDDPALRLGAQRAASAARSAIAMTLIGGFNRLPRTLSRLFRHVRGAVAGSRA